ncbi:alanyl-tRNA editing protein AlaX, partial [Archaeoglobales archaeon ex4484_92]
NKNRPLLERIRKFKQLLEELEGEKDQLRKELWEWKSKALLQEAEEINGVKIISFLDTWEMKDAQAFIVYFIEKNPKTVVLIVGSNYLLFAKNKNIERSPEEVLEIAKKFLKEKIKED